MTDSNERKFVVGMIIIGLGVIYLIRLFYIQVIDDSYKLSADNNVLRYITEYPTRGLIYDRNGELLVYNQASYDLMVIPRQMKEFDTTEFCNTLGLSYEEFITKITKAKKYSSFRPSLFLKQLSAKKYADLQEKLYRFNGVFVQSRTTRKYIHGIAGHLLGNIGEVGKSLIEADDSYKSGDYTGINGIEKSYEATLRGVNGKSIKMVDVFGRVKGRFRDGEYDTKAVPGNDLTLTIDRALQAYGEQLLKNKRGSVVAIEPATGEILALISSPFFDPNLLVGRIRAENYIKLSRDTLKPLFNRALMAQYPPGSTFKLINALIGLQEDVLDTTTYYSCKLGYQAGRLRVGCHNHKSPINLKYSIRTSCNSYYCQTFRSIIDKYSTAEKGFSVWRDHTLSFGLGEKLQIDLPNENAGLIPTISTYDRQHGSGRWRSLSIISLAIGQGEIGVTPLQMANMTSIIANKGFYYLPHIVRKYSANIYTEQDKKYTSIDKEYFDIVQDAMQQVVEKQGGTAGIARIEGTTICGKTGTAQNPHGDDHSIFIAFAPRKSPKIAIAVYIENAGYGSKWAAPIASLMIEEYLTDTVGRTALSNFIMYPDSTFIK